MSRIGNLPITIPDGVQVTVSDKNLVVVKGKLGELEQAVADLENGFGGVATGSGMGAVTTFYMA